jgi:dyslexia susceptibility 1 candidate gene 1 protein
MLLLVKDYTWRQTESVVVIRVPLKGVHYSKVDIFSSDNYIKVYFLGLLCDSHKGVTIFFYSVLLYLFVTFLILLQAHFHPYLFEVFLFASVKEPQNKCTLADGEIVFELQKVECVSWNSLEANLSKVEQQEMRKKVLERAQETAKAEQERKCGM